MLLPNRIKEEVWREEVCPEQFANICPPNLPLPPRKCKRTFFYFHQGNVSPQTAIRLVSCDLGRRYSQQIHVEAGI